MENRRQRRKKQEHLEAEYRRLQSSKKNLESMIALEQTYIPKDTKKLDQLNTRLDGVLREIDYVTRQHNYLTDVGVTNRVKSQNVVDRSKTFDQYNRAR